MSQWIVAVAFVAAAVPAAASADDDAPQHSARIAADGAWFRGSGTHHGYVADGEIWVLRLRAELNVTRAMRLELDVGWAHAFMGGIDTPIGRFDMHDTTRWLNPYVGASWAVRGERTVVRVGVGVALPFAGDDDGEAQANFLGALGAYGMRDPWIWPEGVLSLVVPVELRVRASSAVYLVADAAAALMIRVESQRAGELGPAAQVRGGVELRPVPALRIGALAGVAWLPGTDGDPEQLSVEPFVRLVAGPIELGASLVINVDGPFGPSFSDHRQWGLHLGAAARF